MPQNVTSIDLGQIKPPAGLPDNPCGVDFSQLEALEGLGKFSKEDFLDSLIDFALAQLPGPIAEIINNETVVPQELPGIGAMLGVASMLMNTQSAPSDLQGLWGMFSGNCQAGYAKEASAFVPDLKTFRTAIANMKPANVSPEVIGLISGAYKAIRNGADPMDPRIQAALRSSSTPFDEGSKEAFQAYDSAQALKTTVDALRTPLTATSRIHTAAPKALSTVGGLAIFGASQQLVKSGAAGQSLRLDQINGISNLTPAQLNMSGADALRTLSILRQTSTAVEEFYGMSVPGFGAVKWESMTRDLSVSVAGSAIVGVAEEAAGFAPISPDQIMVGISSTVDQFLSRALSQGGSDNLADAAVIDFGIAVDAGLTAASTVATIYASLGGMSETFENTLSVMQQLGSSAAINQMVGGDFSGLFGLASGAISNPKLALLRAWRDCLQNKGVSPEYLQILDAQIKQEESTANVGWAMTISVFDANGYFHDATSIVKALRKIKEAILKNKPVQVGPTV